MVDNASSGLQLGILAVRPLQELSVVTLLRDSECNGSEPRDHEDDNAC